MYTCIIGMIPFFSYLKCKMYYLCMRLIACQARRRCCIIWSSSSFSNFLLNGPHGKNEWFGQHIQTAWFKPQIVMKIAPKSSNNQRTTCFCWHIDKLFCNFLLSMCVLVIICQISRAANTNEKFIKLKDKNNPVVYFLLFVYSFFIPSDVSFWSFLDNNSRVPSDLAALFFDRTSLACFNYKR